MRKRPVALKYWFEKDAFYKSGRVNDTVFNKDQKVINHGYFANLLYKFNFSASKYCQFVPTLFNHIFYYYLMFILVFT